MNTDNHEKTDSDVLQGLGALPSLDVTPARSEEIWNQAREEFENNAAQSSAATWFDKLASAYNLVLEPLLAAALCVVYLAWAFTAASSIMSPAAPPVPEPPSLAQLDIQGFSPDQAGVVSAQDLPS